MTINFKDYKEKLLFVPLGGSNEIGINVNLYHYKGKWIMVDCGSGFADDHLPGVDMLVVDMDFILERKDDLLGIILTHAHEDHLGAVQYFINELACHIYATKFTANFLKIRLAENGVNTKKIKINSVEPGSKLNLSPFSIEMIGITHSAPEMQGLMIRTDEGNVFHTGDWKFDDDPIVGNVTDEDAIKKCAKEGIDALVCDSTNVFNLESAGSEGELQKSLFEIISSCDKMVVVTTFASNLARLESLINSGKKSGRKIFLAGRSMHRMFKAAQESNYLLDAPTIYDEKDIGRFKREEILVIATGCQGEPLAAISKMANNSHPSIKLAKGDTVIFSSKIIPGNDKKIFRLFNIFVKLGIEVITERDHFVHVSGHPGVPDLKKMIEMTKPKSLIPVHGEPVHIHEHCKLGKKFGVKNNIEVENGSVVEINKSFTQLIGKVDSGYLAVDGKTLLPHDSSIFKARRKIRDSGIIITTIIFDQKGNLLAKPVLDYPGCLDITSDAELIESINFGIIDLLRKDMAGKIKKMKSDEISMAVRSFLRRTIKEEIGKTPPIVVNIQYVRHAQ